MREIYNSEALYDNWLKKAEKKGVPGLNKEYSKLVLQYVNDMSLGLNISNQSKKGGRSKKRLNSVKQKVIFILTQLQNRKIDSVNKITAKILHQLFDDMRTGALPNRYGKPYLSTGNYVKDFKAFWHWHQKVSKKTGVIIDDLTEDLDRRGEKPKFVYFKKEEFEELVKVASRDLQIIMVVLFDAGCRVTELMNIQVKDFSNDFKELEIKDESAKTFGRKIKLMMCSKQVKDYVKELDMKSEDYLIKKSAKMSNNELTLLGKKVLGEDRVKEKNLTMYDFRHSSACFWVIRYKSESALKFRFGWRKSEMIHYYTEFLGMKDTIHEDDLYSDVTKTELEKQNEEIKKELDEIRRQNKKIIKQSEDFMKNAEEKYFEKRFKPWIEEMQKKLPAKLK